MLEKQLERRLKKEVEKLGGLCLKLITPGFTGIPDRLVIMPGGIIWFVEMKTATGKMSDRQVQVFAVLDMLQCNTVELDNTTIETFIKCLQDEI